jgi:hypothetical protein
MDITTTQITIMVNTKALVASSIPLSELHCADVSLPGLTNEDLTPKVDGRGLRLARALCSILYITLGRPERKPGLPIVGCQATNNNGVASVSMEISTTVAL